MVGRFKNKQLVTGPSADEIVKRRRCQVHDGLVEQIKAIRAKLEDPSKLMSAEHEEKLCKLWESLELKLLEVSAEISASDSTPTNAETASPVAGDTQGDCQDEGKGVQDKDESQAAAPSSFAQAAEPPRWSVKGRCQSIKLESETFKERQLQSDANWKEFKDKSEALMLQVQEQIKKVSAKLEGVSAHEASHGQLQALRSKLFGKLQELVRQLKEATAKRQAGKREKRKARCEKTLAWANLSLPGQQTETKAPDKSACESSPLEAVVPVEPDKRQCKGQQEASTAGTAEQQAKALPAKARKPLPRPLSKRSQVPDGMGEAPGSSSAVQRPRPRPSCAPHLEPAHAGLLHSPGTS
eukprot:gb/GFBE01068010.1/.p1 GENE.gb/GFBE01068010.1/~~gb/GFBE01068010.1/.p1  ORF type:complete len:354 (+),score=91.19 gb/GFBE01068010.1/:1-1062(+)